MRIVVASQPIQGHIAPLRPLVSKLVRRGHEVRWYTGRKYASQVRAMGAAWEPFVHARDYDDADFDAAFPGRQERRGLAQLLFNVQHIFAGQLEGQVLDLQALVRWWKPDLILADQTVGAALILEERGGPPVALLGVLPLGIPSRDTAPFGLGLPPTRVPVWGALRNRALQRLTEEVLFAPVSRELRAACGRLGVAGRSFSPPVAPSLMLQPSVPALEYPRSDLPPQLHFIGPLLPEGGAAELPEWWPQLLEKGSPLVVVTQGTLATDPRQLLRPALAALGESGLRVVLAGVRDPQILGPLPKDIYAAAFVPFSELLPHAAVFVTNGGYGGVMQALTHGVPCVVAGRSEDKAEVAARVAYTGAGLNLRTQSPSPARLRWAVQEVLEQPLYRQRAAQLSLQLRQHDAPREAADLLERLAAERRTSP